MSCGLAEDSCGLTRSLRPPSLRRARPAARALQRARAYAEATRGGPDREAAGLARRLQELDGERLGYLRQNARGLLADEELDTLLADVDAQREGTSRAPREARDRGEDIGRLEHSWDVTEQLIGNFVAHLLASPRDRRRLYLALQLRADVDRDGSDRLSGVFDPDLHLLGVMKDPLADEMRPAPDTEGVGPVVTPERPSPGM